MYRSVDPIWSKIFEKNIHMVEKQKQWLPLFDHKKYGNNVSGIMGSGLVYVYFQLITVHFIKLYDVYLNMPTTHVDDAHRVIHTKDISVTHMTLK